MRKYGLLKTIPGSKATTPERDLVRAVLARAFADLYREDCDVEGPHEREAYQWFMSQGRHTRAGVRDVYSIQWVCERLDLDLVAIRRVADSVCGLSKRELTDKFSNLR